MRVVKGVFITPAPLTDYETKSCSFYLCLEAEGYSGNSRSILCSASKSKSCKSCKKSCKFSVSAWENIYLFTYLLLLCIDAETFQHPIHPTCDVCFREGNFTQHIPKQFACQLWIPASRSLTESCPKRSSWGTRSEWQCSHVQTGQHDLGSTAVWELPCSLYFLGKYLSR